MPVIFFDPDEDADDYDEVDVPKPKKEAAKRGPKPKNPQTKPPFHRLQRELIEGLEKSIQSFKKGYYYYGYSRPVSAGNIAYDYVKTYGVGVSPELIVELDSVYSTAKKRQVLLDVARPVVAKYDDVIESAKLNLPYSLLLTLKETDSDYEAKLIFGAACFFAHSDLHRLFMNEQPIEVQRAAESLMWAKKMTGSELSAAIGTAVTQKYKTSSNYFLSPMYQILPHQESSWNQQLTLYWLPHIRKAVLDAYPKPADFELHTVAELPTGLSLWLEDDLVIYDEIQMLIAYGLMNSIALNASGKVSGTAYKRMRKQLGLREFYEADSAYPLVRTTVLAQLLASMPPKKTPKANLDALEWLDELRIVAKKNLVLLFTLTELKNHGSVHFGGYKQQVETELQAWMERLPVDEWVSTANMLNYSQYRELPSLSRCLPGYSALKFETPTTYHYLTDTNAERELDRPGLLAGLWLFAALGWLDLAYEEPKGRLGIDYFSAYDGLRYVRLNALGAHIFGRTEGPYVPKVNKATQALQFDEQSLLIFCDPDNKVAETVLANYAERVSPTRFRVSAGTFLRGCATKTHLQNKITLFSKSVAPNLPANWKAFFDELLLKAEPIKPITNLAVFALAHTDPALIRLLAQDAELKAMVIKAEGYRILVEQGNVPKLKKRLSELGYLV